MPQIRRNGFGEQPMSIGDTSNVNLVFCYSLLWVNSLIGLLALSLPSFLSCTQSGHISGTGNFLPWADNYSAHLLGVVLYSRGFQHELSNLIFVRIMSS